MSLPYIYNKTMVSCRCSMIVPETPLNPEIDEVMTTPPALDEVSWVTGQDMMKAIGVGGTLWGSHENNLGKAHGLGLGHWTMNISPSRPFRPSRFHMCWGHHPFLTPKKKNAVNIINIKKMPQQIHISLSFFGMEAIKWKTKMESPERSLLHPTPEISAQASYLALKWLDPLAGAPGRLSIRPSAPCHRHRWSSEVNRGYERQVNLQDSPSLGDQEDTARNTCPGSATLECGWHSTWVKSTFPGN